MIQGTGSGVGKSILTAALCRWFRNRGWNVAPFKAQNMSLNSHVTVDGDEMGRAQAYQAQACGIEPHVCMNPVLLKPTGDNLSQVVLMGKPLRNVNAQDYFANRDEHMQAVRQAFDYLQERHDLIIIEGAGSPAEINLRERDIVNMATARMANAPVLLVGDIDRGGVFAWMKGTYDLLTPEEQARIAGFIINKFRGDLDLLKPGIEMFEALVPKPVLGVVPFQRELFVDEEDAIPDAAQAAKTPGPSTVRVDILRLPRISNFTDFTPLFEDPNVIARYVWHPSQIQNPDLIIIPGSKNTLGDRAFIREQGLDRALTACHSAGTVLLGICAGFQILGTKLRDPWKVESDLGETDGLGFLNLQTTLNREKQTRQVTASTAGTGFFEEGLPVAGYEIHMGETEWDDSCTALFQDNSAQPAPRLGVSNREGTVFGTYLHGIFDGDVFREAFLNRLRRIRGLPTPQEGFNFSGLREKQFDTLASLIEDHLDTRYILNLLEKSR